MNVEWVRIFKIGIMGIGIGIERGVCVLGGRGRGSGEGGWRLKRWWVFGRKGGEKGMRGRMIKE